MQEFLKNYEAYIDLASKVIFVVLSILLFLKTKDTKYLIEVIEKMKEQTKGQTFTTLKEVYRLNKVTNVLEPTGEYIDIQELVNSSKETALDIVLNRLMPMPTEYEGIQDSVDIMEDNLDIMAQLIEKANAYRLEHSLDANLSVEEVYSQMQKDSVALKEKLSQYEETLKAKEELKKEVLKNEKIQTSQEK